jgi:exopolysaccharide production protein ExoQ
MLRAHYVAGGYFLVFSTGALGFFDRMIYGVWAAKGGDKFTQAMNVLAIVISILLFWWAGKRRRPRLNWVLPLATAGLLVSSVSWSVDPGTTITRSVAYLFLIVGAIGVAGLFDDDEVMGLTASIAGISAAASLLLLFIRPDTVTVEQEFIGMFSQKNVLGQAMVVGVLAGLHGIRIRGRRWIRDTAVTALCTFVAFLSKSATSLVTIFAFFGLHILGTLYIKGGTRRAISIFLTIAIVPTCVLLVMNKDLVFSFLEKDSSLTGRTDLWPYVIEYIYERPVLGWGFAAFWTGSNSRLWEISSALGWHVTEAHNGVLQILLDIGCVGTALFLFLLLRNLVMALKCMNGPAPATGVSSLLFLAAVLLIGVSEQVLVTPDGPTVQFFLLGFMCEQKLRGWTSSRVSTRLLGSGVRTSR